MTKELGFAIYKPQKTINYYFSLVTLREKRPNLEVIATEFIFAGSYSTGAYK